MRVLHEYDEPLSSEAGYVPGPSSAPDLEHGGAKRGMQSAPGSARSAQPSSVETAG
jgi:hypothetical protein